MTALTPLTEPRKELQAPAPLNPQPPLCPMCGNEVDSDGDGGWLCHEDKASWSGLDVGWEKGEWQEEDILACLSMAKHKPSFWHGTDLGWEWQCARPLGHEMPHCSASGAEWPNSWLIQSDPEAAP